MTRGKPGKIRPWTREEEDIIRELYGRGQAQALADLLGRSVDSIRNHAKFLRGGRPRDAETQQNVESRETATRNKEPWTPAEHQYIVDTMDHPIPEVATKLGRTIYSVQQRRHFVLNGYEPHYKDAPRTNQDSGARREKQYKPEDFGDVCPRCTINHRGEC